MERIDRDGPWELPKRLARQMAEREAQLAAIKADTAASAAIREVGQMCLGDDTREVYVALVKRFQAESLQPPFSALQEFAQAISNEDPRWITGLADDS